MDIEKYSYVEALRWLANKYNIEIEETAVSPEYKQQQQTGDSLFIINKFAQEFFTKQLLHTDEGQDIGLSYLHQRGFTNEIIEKFGIGYSPEARDLFAQAAQNAQFSNELLLKSGIVVQRDDRLQDNYRGRILFPIHNQNGKVLGFGARIIKKNDRAPKYINTPENEIYVKSKILYGSYFARQAIDKSDECLLVEGYTDVVSLHQAGVENVVASGGTSLTVDQLRLIKKYSNNLTILYDGDGAGIKAALRGLDLALEERLNVKLVLIPDGEDPDSYVNKVGAAAFKSFVADNKKDFILFQLNIALKDAGTDSTKKMALVNQMAETISKINRAEDFTKRQDYIKQVSEILKIDEAGLNVLVNQFLREKISKEELKSIPDVALPQAPSSDRVIVDTNQLLLNRDEQSEKATVRCLIEFGNKNWDETKTVADYLFARMDEYELDAAFENKELQNILQLYKNWYKQGLKPTEKDFWYHEDRQMGDLVIKTMQAIDNEISPNWSRKYEGHIPNREELYKEEVTSCLNYLILRKIKKMMWENQQEMQKETTPNQLKEMMKLHIELKNLELQIIKEMGTVIFK